MTHAELVAEVEALAVRFQQLDPRPGSRVATCAWNSRGHLLAILATYAAGKVWVPISPRNGQSEIAAMLGATQPGIIFVDESCIRQLPTVSAKLMRSDHVPMAVERAAGQKPVPVPRGPEDDQVIKFSGGSTGKPKA